MDGSNVWSPAYAKELVGDPLTCRDLGMLADALAWDVLAEIEKRIGGRALDRRPYFLGRIRRLISIELERRFDTASSEPLTTAPFLEFVPLKGGKTRPKGNGQVGWGLVKYRESKR